MVTRIINKLPIRSKLYVVTTITMLNLLLIAWGVNYFFSTYRVLIILSNAERIHMNYFQQGVIGFQKFKTNQHKATAELSMQMIERANNMAFVFGRIDSIAANSSNEAFEALLLKVLYESLENDPRNARLLANRCKLFLSIKDKRFLETVETSYRGYRKGSAVLETIDNYFASPSPEAEEKLQRQLDDIQKEYEVFAESLTGLGNYGQYLLIWMLVILISVSGLIILLVSFRLSNMITKPIINIASKFELMSKGHTEEQIETKSQDEIGRLVDSFNKLSVSVSEIIGYAKKVAEGDYSAMIEARSDKDELAFALNRTTAFLLKTEQEQAHFDWLKNGKNLLNEHIRGENSLEDLSEKILHFLAKYLNMQLGAMYVNLIDGQFLHLTATYGAAKGQLKDGYSPGESLVGQVFNNMQPIIVEQPEGGTYFVSSALQKTPAKALMLFPLVFDKQVFGVIEMATVSQLTTGIIAFMNEVNESIAVSVRTSLSRMKLSELLSTTQQQAEELQTQQEELRVANEELEEQTVALKLNEKRLQEQQEELKVTNEELEERTQDLEMQKKAISEKNLELENARKALEFKASQLEVTSKYKSEFLANMSHELRTPLNSLLILSRDLSENKKNNLTPDQIEASRIIYNSGNDLLNLINEILDLAKIESGKMTINPEAISWKGISGQLKDSFQHMAGQKQLSFDVSALPGAPEKFVSDKLRLLQIIKNLVSNAIKFTHNGGITITIGPVAKSASLRQNNIDKNDFFAIAVTDTGIGIAPEKQLEIFEAFHQADGSISRKYGGTGLGLSITRELSKLLGGEITLSSVPGEGSVFTLVLPKKLSEKPQNLPKNELKIDEPIGIPFKTTQDFIETKEFEQFDREPVFISDDRDNLASGDKVLLIVEDDRNFASILLLQGRERGFKCIVAGTGEHALLATDKVLPDAIILDIKLPGMSGYKVLDALKEDQRTRHIPVHIMSAMEESLEAFQKGAIGFVTKPASQEKLDMAFTRISTFVNKNIKDLLLVEDNDEMRSLITKIIGGKDVNVCEVTTGKLAIEQISERQFDCMVLDLGLPDMSGLELLRKLNELENINIPPVIIYTAKELSREEDHELRKYASSIIIKGVKSDERLLDETALFLHRVVGNLPQGKQNIIATLHDKEAVFRNKTILLIDDDMRNVFALTKILEEHGMLVIEAENGKIGIQKLMANKQVDLVLMDIMMPEMDGYTAIREIRKHANWKKLPIITLTAKAMKEDKEKSIQAGANDYLSKPVDVAKLLSMLRVWLYK
ncbi:MAG: response regulator [Bacteroidetes bacterium]|nr:response regulator [Bacteroidota bacterium]